MRLQKMRGLDRKITEKSEVSEKTSIYNIKNWLAVSVKIHANERCEERRIKVKRKLKIIK